MTRSRPKGPPDPSVGVGFSEPPEPRVLKYDWTKIAEKLRKQPGRWLLVFRQDKQTYATTLRQDGITALTSRKGFEIRTENNRTNCSPRLCDLYLRYVPENDSTKEG